MDELDSFQSGVVDFLSEKDIPDNLEMNQGDDQIVLLINDGITYRFEIKFQGDTASVIYSISDDDSEVDISHRYLGTAESIYQYVESQMPDST